MTNFGDHSDWATFNGFTLHNVLISLVGSFNIKIQICFSCANFVLKVSPYLKGMTLILHHPLDIRETTVDTKEDFLYCISEFGLNIF